MATSILDCVARRLLHVNPQILVSLLLLRLLMHTRHKLISPLMFSLSLPPRDHEDVPETAGDNDTEDSVGAFSNACSPSQRGPSMADQHN